MKRWIITGCSSGIGRAIAEHVLAQGDAVAVTARNPADIADIVEPYPERAIALTLDVSHSGQVSTAIAAAQSRMGGIDILVNNAGYGYFGSIEEGDENAVRALFETNMYGALRMMKGVLPGMRATGSGTIINIGSLSGRVAYPAVGYYAASKFALEALSDVLAQEVAPFGIRVCSIAPGRVLSDFTSRSLKTVGQSVPDYGNGVHAAVDIIRAEHGSQEGDPRKLAALVAKVAQMTNPPRQMAAGSDAYAAIMTHLDEVRSSLEMHRELSQSTDFEA